MYPAQTLIHSIVVQEYPGYLSPVPSPEVFADSLSCQLFLRRVPITCRRKVPNSREPLRAAAGLILENRTVFLPPQLSTGSIRSVFLKVS